MRKWFSIFKPRLAQKNIKILVIEDMEVDQRLACAAIEKGGYTALKAYDGKTGFDLAKQEKPDLIILDYNLPDTKGPDLCKLLKMHYDTEKIPVLFLTSMDTPESILNCYQEGGENYLAKPISSGLLLKQIDLILHDTQRS